MRVRATNPGYYGSFRGVGAVFDITHEKHFSKNWMERIVGGGEASASPSPQTDGAGGDQSEIKSLRDEYKRVLGKNPFAGWSAEVLREKIAKAS